MRTFKSLTLAALAVSPLSFGAHGLQSGGHPIKLIGPSIISSSSKRMRATNDETYTYEVDLSAAQTTDTVITIDDVTASAQPVQYHITIPAGQLSATFDVVAAYPGEDELIASTPYSSASLDIYVL